jgi:hypothetical protein
MWRIADFQNWVGLFRKAPNPDDIFYRLKHLGDRRDRARLWMASLDSDAEPKFIRRDTDRGLRPWHQNKDILTPVLQKPGRLKGSSSYLVADFDLAFADFDGDGRNDVYLGGSTGQDTLWLNQSDRTFEGSEPTHFDAPTGSPADVTAGNMLPGESAEVAVLGRSSPGMLKVMSVRPDGETKKTPDIKIPSATTLKAGDLDEDGLDELIVRRISGRIEIVDTRDGDLRSVRQVGSVGVVDMATEHVNLSNSGKISTSLMPPGMNEKKRGR